MRVPATRQSCVTCPCPGSLRLGAPKVCCRKTLAVTSPGNDSSPHPAHIRVTNLHWLIWYGVYRALCQGICPERQIWSVVLGTTSWHASGGPVAHAARMQRPIVFESMRKSPIDSFSLPCRCGCVKQACRLTHNQSYRHFPKELRALETPCMTHETTRMRCFGF